MNENIREIIVKTLCTLETEEKKSHLLIREVLDKYDWLPYRDKAFFKKVTEGTVANRLTLDYVLDGVSSKPMSKCKPVIRVILRMSTYQLLFMDKVPESAVCNEAVKLCESLGRKELCPFVNGILRTLARNGRSLPDFSEIEDDVRRISVRYSVPEWIVAMFKKEQPDYEALVASLVKERNTCVRVTDEKLIPEITEEWRKAGVSFSESRLVRGAFILEGFEGVSSLYGFKEGNLIVQDESSMLAALATGIEKGDDKTMIDTCAAPGGKSSFAAALMSPGGRVSSFDISETKVSLIRDNFERLGLKNAEARVQDATVYDESLKESADVVLVDAPCSGLGVLGRKSDLRYGISNEAMRDICKLQKDILSVAVRYVKPGGVLIYSTCTVHKAENEKAVRYILDNFPFEPDSLKPFLPTLFERERDYEHMLQLRPDNDGCDGFFISRFVKHGKD
ncbi:MAG: 16S rRNA (cytosine(967)-C(5))-methyltransferase RsmB [Lachnospiraceae bacterium]|nr:16S rRNA (cytosine(967)-C(5))-methyltransferase RsmB [Lachnospiraceae bacterium]